MSRRMAFTTIIVLAFLIVLMIIIGKVCIDRSNETITRVDRHIEEVLDE